MILGITPLNDDTLTELVARIFWEDMMFGASPTLMDMAGIKYEVFEV